MICSRCTKLEREASMDHWVSGNDGHHTVNICFWIGWCRMSQRNWLFGKPVKAILISISGRWLKNYDDDDDVGDGVI